MPCTSCRWRSAGKTTRTTCARSRRSRWRAFASRPTSACSATRSPTRASAATWSRRSAPAAACRPGMARCASCAARACPELSADEIASLQVAALHTQSTNTSVQLGDRFFLKCYRRMRAGVNPEFEVGRFLTEVARFPHCVPLAGAVEYVSQTRIFYGGAAPGLHAKPGRRLGLYAGLPRALPRRHADGKAARRLRQPDADARHAHGRAAPRLRHAHRRSGVRARAAHGRGFRGMEGKGPARGERHPGPAGEKLERKSAALAGPAREAHGVHRRPARRRRARV